jgi:hypothetical protein
MVVSPSANSFLIGSIRSPTLPKQSVVPRWQQQASAVTPVAKQDQVFA